MRGASNPPQYPDPHTRAVQVETDAHQVEIMPEQLLGLFNNEWVAKNDAYHRTMIRLPLKQLIEQPLCAPNTKREAELNQLATHNRADYGDEAEDTIYEDDVLGSLLARRTDYQGNEHFSELVRARRTVIAHYLFTLSVQSEQTAHNS